MLYIVPKTPLSSSLNASFPAPEDLHKQQFLSNFEKVSSKLFSFYARDARDGLECSLRLDTQNIFSPEEGEDSEDGYMIPMLLGDFPAIDRQALYRKVFGDEYLCEMLTIRFYLNLLEALFLFCEEQNANGLILNVYDDCLDAIEVYRPFIAAEIEVMMGKGEHAQIVIPTEVHRYDKLIDFIEKTNQDFRQTLWRSQKGNPIIRQYLKSHATAEF